MWAVQSAEWAHAPTGATGRYAGALAMRCPQLGVPSSVVPISVVPISVVPNHSLTLNLSTSAFRFAVSDDVSSLDAASCSELPAFDWVTLSSSPIPRLI
jgi:hypothetical protein